VKPFEFRLSEVKGVLDYVIIQTGEVIIEKSEYSQYIIKTALLD
jgi:hypothetical protein